MSLPLSYLHSKDEETLRSILRIQRNLSLLLLKHVAAEIDAREATQVRNEIKEICRVDFNVGQIKVMLNAYPEVKAKLVEFGIGDTETRDSIANMVANFFLGTDWPTGGDKFPDMALFVKLITQQADSMGYALV